MINKWVVLDAMGVIFEVGHVLNELLIPFIKEKNEKIPLDLIYRTYLQASLGNISSHYVWRRLKNFC